MQADPADRLIGLHRANRPELLPDPVELDQFTADADHGSIFKKPMKEDAMPKLLVPVDGSESSMRALDHAINIAKTNASYELHLLTVQPEPIMYGEILVYVSREKMHELQRAHSTDLLRPAIQAAEKAQVAHTSEIAEGDVASTIVKRAHELHCEGIVMGTRGMTAISNLVIGSVATKVIHLTNIPVTLVK